MSDLISRADAIEAVAQQWLFEASVGNPYVNDDDIGEYRKLAEELFEDVPSADATIGDYPNDLISRSALMEYCSNQKSKTIDNNDIARFPSADAVQGEWIYDGQNFKGGLDWCHCSECGYKTSTNGLSVYRYCPNCGARMKGGAE